MSHGVESWGSLPPPQKNYLRKTLKTVTSLNKEARLLKIPFFLSDNSIWGQ